MPDGADMPARRLPYEKWWWGDWFGDADLSGCSIAARGAWHDALGRMWQQDGPDHLLTADYERFGRWWGCSPDMARMLIEELKMAGVCDFEAESNGKVTLLSRRRHRISSGRKFNAERQKRHRDRQRNAIVTPKVTPRVTPLSRSCNGESLESRVQSPESTVRSGSTHEGHPKLRLGPADLGLPRQTGDSSQAKGNQ